MTDINIEQALRTAIGQHQAGQLESAAAIYNQILLQQPNHPDALNLLGVIHRQMGQPELAVEFLRRAVAVAPNWPEALGNLGNALRANGQLNQAVIAYRRAVDLKPEMPELHGNLGIALQEQGCPDEAISEYHRAIALRFNYPAAHYNLGVALIDKRQLIEAIAAFNQAIALDPQLADAHFGLALLLLQQGDYVQGWKEYEWRWQSKDFNSDRWKYSQPQWDGSDLASRTLFLHDEQGMGDSIQFIRYVPLAAAKGAKILLGCPPALRRLMRGSADREHGPDWGVARWIDWRELLPAFDVHCPLLSLPLALGTSAGSIPSSVPYLYADARDVERWRRELAGDTSRLKVGLVWAGSPIHKGDAQRSISLDALAPLGQIRGVSFYSLQRGEAASQAKRPPAGLNLIDRTEELNDFADTAGLIANLDLVICVDTAVAHLAGAMAKPVWTMLPFIPDWRWMLDRNDSPWYPTMRLFRQPSAGDWGSVVREVAEALAGEWTDPNYPARSRDSLL
jgi:Flp pilus assembly protein TadD